ncbi:MAG TPA: M15 family metallopeptidase, partial [Treponemataceae bacterium]|nr:M15 family metallopeptidase [Treponemataceae bacterium]
PAAVVEAFEREGFVWGGKWLLWDNMHFEYRPELLVLQKWGHKGDLKAK